MTEMAAPMMAETGKNPILTPILPRMRRAFITNISALLYRSFPITIMLQKHTRRADTREYITLHFASQRQTSPHILSFIQTIQMTERIPMNTVIPGISTPRTVYTLMFATMNTKARTT